MKRIILLIGLQLLRIESQAVNINHNGLGEVLYAPYYSVNNNMNTYVSIENTTDQAKAIKFHFREGMNGAFVLTYNVYLAPRDTWAFALGGTPSTYQGFIGEDSATMVFSDDSCVPWVRSSIEFRPFEIMKEPTEVNIQRAREGVIEIYEMGEIVEGSKIHNSIVDGDCDDVKSFWDELNGGGEWLENPNQDLSPVSGGLTASIGIINVAEGVIFTYDAIALEDFYPQDTIIHTIPGEISAPTLAHANPRSLMIHDGKAIDVTWESGINAVSSLFMRTDVNHAFEASPSIAAETELIYVFPTKRYYVQEETSTPPFGNVHLSQQHTHCPEAYGSVLFNPYITNRDAYHDKYISRGFGLIDGPPFYNNRAAVYPKFCSMVNTVSLNNIEVSTNFVLVDSNSSLLGSATYIPIFLKDLFSPYVDINNGGIKVNMEGEYTTLDSPSAPIIGTHADTGKMYEFHGLPVISMAFQQYYNAHAQPGLLARYGGIYQAKNQVKIVEIEP